jgi:hypothetical protein
MTHVEAINLCWKAYHAGAPLWPALLITYLDEPPSEKRVFAWLTSCVGELLDHLGASTAELEDSMTMARRCAVEGTGLEPIEQRAWELWSRRETEGGPRTAVAQLLFALRAHRRRKDSYRGSCAVPIVVLDGLSTHRGKIPERVVDSFLKYVSAESSGSVAAADQRTLEKYFRDDGQIL